MRCKCPLCGKFLKDVEALCTFDEEITEVFGICAKHGKVNPTDWEYDMFFPIETVEIGGSLEN